ncbi:MAG: GMC family oxidoreductase [bacterium]|nr:GMC family oxidoreductase [bacterium]
MAITRREFLAGAGALAASTLACPRHPEPWDVCVIGSGFAGMHLALRTADAGLNTIIVEAGPRPETDSGEDLRGDLFAYRNSGEVQYPLNSTRAIGVGGTSRLWGGVSTRLWPSDFRMRTNHGLWTNWPISYEDLVPYYCEAEQLLSVRGGDVVPAAEPPRECPYPVPLRQPPGNPDVRVEGAPRPFFRVPRSRRSGRPVRLAQDELSRFEAHPLGTLLPGLQVTRIVTQDGATVDHLEARPITGGDVRKISARYFVVAAGAIESARLLLLSRSPDGEGLGNRHGQVGRYFAVHPSLQIRLVPSRPINVTHGSYRTYALNDLYRKQGLNAAHYQLDVLDSDRLRWRVQPEIEPQAENRVALGDSATDSRGLPLPDLRLTYSDRDQRTFQRCRAFVAETRADLRAVEGSGREKFPWWRSHTSGTCRMGSDPTSGVVDANNLVFGTRNLFVSGGATFPNAGTANPVSTIVALTLRLGDHIRGLAARG